ncbi:hypothetical protein [Flavobacterium rhizosphaerae]|uniref:Antitoxin HicB n=1 Tax=Flavobacterium rhizosphaerae TaxID=3163298 RepID=A0ABW8YXX1_9FLAO
MSINFTDIYDTIRIKQGKVKITAMTAFGKEGDHYVIVAPSILVSGYGSTTEEAEASFLEGMNLFCEDLMKLTSEQRDAELKKMGFERNRFQRKNFSKAYIDENGVLRDLEIERVTKGNFEAAV